eukprot:COSAG04_NODE_72_length_29124_cov_43.127265_20_plen_54_part_00
MAAQLADGARTSAGFMAVAEATKERNTKHAEKRRKGKGKYAAEGAGLPGSTGR